MNPFGAEITKTSDNPPMAVVQQQMVDPSNPFGAPITKTGQVSPGTSQGPVSPPASPTEPAQSNKFNWRTDLPEYVAGPLEVGETFVEGALGFGAGAAGAVVQASEKLLPGHKDSDEIARKIRNIREDTGLFASELIAGGPQSRTGQYMANKIGDFFHFLKENAFDKVSEAVSTPFIAREYGLIPRGTAKKLETWAEDNGLTFPIAGELASLATEVYVLHKASSAMKKAKGGVKDAFDYKEFNKDSFDQFSHDLLKDVRNNTKAGMSPEEAAINALNKKSAQTTDELIQQRREGAQEYISRVKGFENVLDPEYAARKAAQDKMGRETVERPVEDFSRLKEQNAAKSRQDIIDRTLADADIPPDLAMRARRAIQKRLGSTTVEIPERDIIAEAQRLRQRDIDRVREEPIPPEDPVDRVAELRRRNDEIIKEQEGYEPPAPEPAPKTIPRVGEYPLHKAQKPPKIPDKMPTQETPAQKILREMEERIAEKKKSREVPIETPVKRGPVETPTLAQKPSIGPQVPKPTPPEQIKSVRELPLSEDGYIDFDRAYEWLEVELQDRYENFNPKTATVIDRAAVRAMEGKPLTLPQQRKLSKWYEEEVKTEKFDPELNRMRRGLEPFESKTVRPRELWDELGLERIGESVDYGITEASLKKQAIDAVNRDYSGKAKTYLLSRIEELWTERQKFNKDYESLWKRIINNERGEITISPEARSKLSEYIKKARFKGIPLNQYLKNEGFSDQHSKTLSDLADGMVKEKANPYVASSNEGVIKTHEELRENVLEMGDLTSKQGVQILSFGRQIETASQTFHELGKKMRETFYRPIKYAEKAEIVEKAEYKKTLNHLFRGVNRNSRRKIGINLIADQKNVGVWDKKVVHGRDALREMGIDQVPALSPKELEVKSKIRDHMEQFYEDVNAAREAAGMKPFPYRENYFTFMRDMNKLDSVLMSGGNGTNPLAMDVKSLRQLFFEHKRTPGFRFAKRRHIDKIGLELDPLRVMKRYGDSAIHFKNIAPVTARLSDLLKPKKMDIVGSDGTVRQGKWSLADDAPLANRMLRDWVDFQAGKVPPTRVPHAIDNALRKVNRNLAWAVLSYNFRSALIQPTALKNTYLKIGAGYTIEGILEAANPKSIMMARQKSNVLRGRAFQDVSVKDAFEWAKSKPFAGVRAMTGKFGMRPLQALDYMTATATWIGAYRKALKAGKNEKSAIDYADDVVTDTQASGAKSDISPLQRSNIGKTMSLFQTFVINDWNFLMNDVLQYKKSNVNGIRAKQVMRLMAATAAINFIYEEMLNTNSPYPTPYKAFDEALEDWDRAGDDNQIKQFPRSVYAAMQIGKELAEYVPVAGGGIRYGSSIPAAFSEVQKLLNENDWTSILKLGGISGTNQILKTLRAVEAGETDPWTLSVGLGPEYYRDKKIKSSSTGLRKPSSALKGLKTLKSLEP